MKLKIEIFWSRVVQQTKENKNIRRYIVAKELKPQKPKLLKSIPFASSLFLFGLSILVYKPPPSISSSSDCNTTNTTQSIPYASNTHFQRILNKFKRKKKKKKKKVGLHKKK